MSPRKYDRTKRRAASDAVRRRIVQAVVRLHAKHGVRATTHAMIAGEADVSIPTVYNHFAGQSEVVGACGAHLATLVPPFDPALLDARRDLRARLSAVVAGLFGTYSILEPWMRWGRAEAESVPELGANRDQQRRRRQDLLRKALAPEFGSRLPGRLVALGDALLDFPSWDTLVRHHRLSNSHAEELVLGLLMAEAGRLKRKEK